jgi:Tfp pilus assembly protein PilN
MSARKSQPQINLLPQKNFEQTTTGRVLAWILSTFRIIVIVTEIIVMIAFMSRFWLDAKNTDLTDEINDKKAVLAASSNFEREFKDTQARLAIFSQTIATQEIPSTSLVTVTSYLPDNVNLTSFSLTRNAIVLQGSSPDEMSIQQFLTNLTASGKFRDVNLTELESDLTDITQLNFSVGAQVSGALERSSP